MDNESNGPNERYKVGRVVSKYGLNDLHAELPSRWLGDGHEVQSLRTLADELNITILEEAMREAGLDTLEGEARNAYRLLTDDEVSAGVQIQQRNRLTHNGVDLDTVTDDFVTHQAVYAYLTDALGVSKETDDPNTSVEKHGQRINRLQSRTEAVTEDSLATLAAADELSLGDPDVVVDVQVYCHQCGTQSDISTLLRQGGCNCTE